MAFHRLSTVLNKYAKRGESDDDRRIKRSIVWMVVAVLAAIQLIAFFAHIYKESFIVSVVALFAGVTFGLLAAFAGCARKCKGISRNRLAFTSKMIIVLSIVTVASFITAIEITATDYLSFEYIKYQQEIEPDMDMTLDEFTREFNSKECAGMVIGEWLPDDAPVYARWFANGSSEREAKKYYKTMLSEHIWLHISTRVSNHMVDGVFLEIEFLNDHSYGTIIALCSDHEMEAAFSRIAQVVEPALQEGEAKQWFNSLYFAPDSLQQGNHNDFEFRNLNAKRHFIRFGYHLNTSVGKPKGVFEFY